MNNSLVNTWGKDENGNPDVTRVEFNNISEEQKRHVKEIKLKVNELMVLFQGGYTLNTDEQRLWQKARDDLEQAAMWAVKAATCSENL